MLTSLRWRPRSVTKFCMYGAPGDKPSIPSPVERQRGSTARKRGRGSAWLGAAFTPQLCCHADWERERFSYFSTRGLNKLRGVGSLNLIKEYRFLWWSLGMRLIYFVLYTLVSVLVFSCLYIILCVYLPVPFGSQREIRTHKHDNQTVYTQLCVLS